MRLFTPRKPSSPLAQEPRFAPKTAASPATQTFE